jgi:hypothetical protein
VTSICADILLQLFVNGTNKLVALYRPRKISFSKGHQPATLDIFMEGRHMTDLIMVTFTYIEKLRYEAEQAKRRGGGP